MRKINRNIENPVDNIFIDIASYSASFYKKLNLTPNDLTTISLVFGILSYFFLIKNYRIMAVIFFLIAYYFDCADGYYARAYNMESTVGDYYDHFSDYFKYVLILWALYTLSSEKYVGYYMFIMIMTSLLMVHMGCQEKNNGHGKDTMLTTFKSLCPNKNMIKYTRFFGCGTFNIVIAIIMLIY